MAIQVYKTDKIPQPQELETLTFEEWLHSFSWDQGEHVVIIGPTGTGKTTLAEVILERRSYVCVLAVKKHDDTLEVFKQHGYTVIKEWPPVHGRRRVIFWPKPEHLRDRGGDQATRLYNALNAMYQSGGWTIYFDEVGYVAGHLGMGDAVGVLLNQGRSSSITIVAVMTRPASVVARVPKEALNQPRHKIIFKYDNEDEQKACAKIADISLQHMRLYMQQLEYHKAARSEFSDFLYVKNGKVVIVRNRVQ